MKKKWIFLTFSLILAFGIFRLVNPNLNKEVSALDCKSTYQKSIFGREYEGFNYHNAKMDLAKCLCEKYAATKDEKYKSEIKKILLEFEYDKIEETNYDEICKNSETFFGYWYYE